VLSYTGDHQVSLKTFVVNLTSFESFYLTFTTTSRDCCLCFLIAVLFLSILDCCLMQLNVQNEYIMMIMVI
jgi:hypothetical protein